jgi:glycosyltransferase involved in cell wall biosynthesis
MTAPVNISVLVPVYNVEPYLAQCLESICSQTLRELEIVCVDDASTDGSLSILREFAERDPRVKVVQAPENGGLSRSRNLAMSHAVGEYLFLVDSDDWLETDLLEEMYRRAKALDADRLACGFRYYYESAPDREDRFLPENIAPPEKKWLPCTPETIGKIHHKRRINEKVVWLFVPHPPVPRQLPFEAFLGSQFSMNLQSGHSKP